MSTGKLDLRAVIGASGSGKSVWVKTRALPELVRARRRVIVWDWMHEYGGSAELFSKFGPLVARLKAQRGPGVFAYQPTKDAISTPVEFHTWCGLVLASPGCAAIAEELSDVTRSSWAPPRWLTVVKQGRHINLTVIGTTQAPALCDKTFFSNATIIRCGRLNAASHKKYMADALDVDIAEIRALQPLQWIQKDMATGLVTRELLPTPGPSRVISSRRRALSKRASKAKTPS